MIRARGFTLLEVLFAVTISALLLTAAWQWLSSAIAAGQRARERLDLLEEAWSIARLMQDDAAGIPTDIGGALVKEDQFHCVTSAVVPGQADSGWRTILWRWSATDGLVRQDGDRARVISRRLRCRWRSGDGAPPWAWIELTPTLAVGAGTWVFPLDAP